MGFDPLAFVEQHGVVLAAGRGPVPSIASTVAGEPIKGSWWGHPAGHAIFAALEVVSESPDVLCFKLIDGKVTFVHRRCWAALVRLADAIGPERLAAVRQEHTASGKHVNVVIPFPDWVPADVRADAQGLDQAAARNLRGRWL